MTNTFQRNKSKRAMFESSFQQFCHDSQQPMKKVRRGGFSNTEDNERALHIDVPPVTPKLVSPMTSPLHSPSTSPSVVVQVTLDLTVPTSQFPRASLSTTNGIDLSVPSSNKDGIQQAHRNHSYSEDPDILAGCRALLSFSHGLHSLTA